MFYISLGKICCPHGKFYSMCKVGLVCQIGQNLAKRNSVLRRLFAKISNADTHTHTHTWANHKVTLKPSDYLNQRSR